MLLLALSLAQAEVVDRVIVVVGDTPVLASEVRLEEALAAVDRSPVPFWSASSPTDRLVDAAIVRRHAENVALYQPAKPDVAARVAAVRQAFPNVTAWNAFLGANGLDEGRLAAIVKRRMVVEKFLLRTLQPSPDDRDAWLADCARLLENLRSGMTIRVVPEGGRPDSATDASRPEAESQPEEGG